MNLLNRQVCAIVSPNVRPRRVEAQDTVRRNDQIRVREVRLIGAEGEQLGIVDRNDALNLAREAGLDLVEVAATAVPPVCRIMDYGRFRYEAQKKKQEAKKRQTVIQIKEIKLRPKTDEHDYLTKLGHIRRFIEDGDRCKVTVFFRGREIVHKDRGQIMLDRVVEDTRDIARVEQEPRAEGRTLHMLLTGLPRK
ncbi:MAG: translation initiation factor IF-3 [Desulfovibrio sp.]|nr:translation initiation factor IF-3 [Desulfovibrio sp.]